MATAQKASRTLPSTNAEAIQIPALTSIWLIIQLSLLPESIDIPSGRVMTIIDHTG